MPTEQEDLLPRSGALRPPGELGHALSPSESDISKGKGGKHSKAHPAVIQAYQEEQAAIERNHRARHASTPPPPVGALSMVTALCYNGMPIVVGTTRHGCYVICPQTHLLYQTLSLGSSAEIIALVSCDETGLLVVAHADGYVQTYLPRGCDPLQENFGPYRWWDAAYYDCKSLFSAKDFKGDLDVSLSHNYKFLVAHADQLAVLSIHSSVDTQGPMKEAEILWTTQLPGRVAMARISGNAHSIAVVLHKNADDDDGSEGVHTFDRDWNDGSHFQSDSSLSEGPTQRAPLIRSTSVGILYRPGPFLVHGAAVTTLSFRGLGHLSVHSVATERGNDLLLTHCARDSVARIFAQHHWKELVDWTTLRNTRVEWIRGISAFTLGDLASHRSKKGGAIPRTKSEEDMYDILGKGAPAHSMPNHAQPYSGAGAWISELSFHGALPTIRLSRLTYLQRGIDEAYPSLFECVSSLVPPNTFFSHGILDTTSCGFCVQAIWPAWNPWLSDTNNRTDDTDTLRGSAMSFLGLSTGVNTTGGHFGGSLLGITETPPLELRITCTHPIGGRIMLTGFRLRGDETAIDVELPRRAELSLADLDRFIVSKTETMAPQASRQHESGRLSARVSTTLQSVDVLWHRPGTASFLPSTWHPEDVDRLGKAFAEATVVHDESLLSVPLVESLFHLPKELRHDAILDVLWWPTREPTFGGPSYVAAVTTGGSIVIFSVPPPYGFLETNMPDKDECFPEGDEGRISHAHTFTSEKTVHTRSEYEVFITPDPDHGLGLRLESKVDGLCAVAGSFKKHPLNGDMLPAERTGMICLGDELISANGIGLENQRFEDIIARVRESGLSAGPGNPIRLMFRPLQQISIAQSYTSRNTFESGDTGQTTGQNDFKTSSSIGSIKSAAQYVSPFMSFGRADTFSNVIAVLEGALTTGSSRQTSDNRFVLVPLFQLIHSAENGALFIALDGAEVQVFSIFLNNSANGAKLEKLDQANVSDSSDFCYARSFSTLRTCIGGVELALWDMQGKLSLLRISIDQEKNKQLGVTFKLYEGVQLCGPLSLVRGYSCALFATMANCDDGRRKSIVVHSCTSHSGLKDETQFASQEISVSSDPNDDRIVDFCFLSSGYLAPAPILVVFSCTGLTVYRKGVCSTEWTPSLKIRYTKMKNSSAYLSSPSDLTIYESVPGISMIDSFPHLLSGLSLTHQAKDEEDCLLNDWSPESLLAYICLEGKGVNHALQSYVLDIMRWIHSECKSSGYAFLAKALPCAPIDICKKLNTFHADNENAALHSTLDHRQAGNNDALDKFLQDILINFDEKYQFDRNGRNLTINVAPSEADKRPSSRLRLDFDLSMFHAIGQLALAPPNFQATDSCGELFVFAASLMQQLEQDADNQCVLNNDTKNAVQDIARQSHTQILADFHVASSACLAAMISADQEILLERCRSLGQKLTWDNARKLRIPLWLRSDLALAKVCEEIGQTSFREGRDVMDCAIFFIACGKLRTLKNLAATDQSEMGKKFFKFLTSHDFESTRGRLAAEKNAFSLLRKNKHRAAASFFLLSKPPSLKSAVETILTKLNDIDLAFLVMRLMTNSDLCKHTSPSLLSLGGGFMAAHAYKVGVPDQKENQEPAFHDWSSGLSISARNFLIDRLLPMAVEDSALTSIILYWLNEKDLSPWILSKTVGIAFDKHGGRSICRKDAMDWITTGSFTRSWLTRNVDVLTKSNRIIDIVSRPTLLMRLQSPGKPLFTAVLSTSSTLLASGLELPALQTLFKLSHNVRDGEKKIAEKPQISSSHYAPERTTVLNVPFSSGAMHSSIFDDFAGPPKPTQQSNHSASGAMESSIFNDFAGPPKLVQQTNHSASGAMESSIFDDFAGPPKPTQQSNHSASGAMESSIFDDFVVPTMLVSGSSASFSGIDEAHRISQQQPPCRDKNISETELQLHLSIEPSQSPPIWNELVNELKCTGAARRLLREIARAFANCQTDPTESPIDLFDKQNLLVPEVSSVLQLPCDGESMLARAEEILSDISNWSQIDASCLIQRALSIIKTADKSRLVFEVVLYCISGRLDLAEFAVRVASRGLIDRCSSLVRSTDTSNLNTRSRFRSSSRFLRRQSARISWQLELCLWLHRGDSFPLSLLGMKESICAIRLGLLIASWNRDYASIQALVENPPDCPLDENTGRLLWTSLCCKDPEKPQIKEKGGTSGGWEFLVDCKRSQATDMLKDRPTGCFIIRPHTKDHGVFTLSFKTNLTPAKEEKEDKGEANAESLGDQLSDQETSNISTGQATKSTKKNDVVQHAIIRLSESGFRCGSFGPFASLMSLLEAVSASLPFKLRFDKPPANHLILDEGSQTSPNAVLIHKLAALTKEDHPITDEVFIDTANTSSALQTSTILGRTHINETAQLDRVRVFSSFLNLMKVLSLCRQLTSVAAVTSDDEPKIPHYAESDRDWDISTCRQYQVLDGHRILHPFLSWCRAAEILVMSNFTSHRFSIVRPFGNSDAGASEESGEVQSVDQNLRGDGMLRKMIQQGSGVEFSTLRLVDGGECTMVVLFKRNDALEWLVSSGYEQSEAEAANRLVSMENARFIEPVDLSKLRLKHKGAATEEVVTYRFIDPWEVEALENRDAETRAATLGRSKVLGFSLGRVSFALDPLLLAIGGVPLLDLWNSLQGGVLMTKAIASLHPPWERAAGGDLIIGSEPSQSPNMNSIRKMLYRNSIFRALRLPQRFITLIQVELLDLKNLTSPGGSLTLTVYALLRPKRAGHGANLTNKARTLDSAATQPVKLTKSTGPNAPASWGSVVRFRFGLPEDVSIDGTSKDSDQESIFKGPPTFLQLSVYEKKLLVDHLLGSADVSMDGLWPGGQLEEWVPLRSDKSSITWFARIRLTLRFEMMCLAEKGSEAPDREAPSVGLRRIEELSRAGGAAHEERFEKRSLSSPDLLSYFESMVY